MKEAGLSSQDELSWESRRRGVCVCVKYCRRDWWVVNEAGSGWAGSKDQGQEKRQTVVSSCVRCCWETRPCYVSRLAIPYGALLALSLWQSLCLSLLSAGLTGARPGSACLFVSL